MLCCCVPLCKSNFKKHQNVSFHEFPCENQMRSAWIKAISRKNFIPNDKSNSSRICSLHFKEDDYIPNLKVRRLKKKSVPSIFPGSERGNESGRKKPKCHICSKEFFTFSDVLEHLKTKHTSWFRNIEYISCCISGCQSKSPRKIEYNSEIGEENILMFPVPRTGTLFNQWKEALKGTGTELTWDDHICEHHFLENDIERYHRTKSPGGDIIEIQKKLPTLKSDAVPIKFLKPSHLITKNPSKKQQSASENSFVVNCERNLCDNSNLTLNVCDSIDCVVDNEIEMCYDSSVDSLANISDSSVKYMPEQVLHKTKCLLYSELVESIQLVKKPSKFWSVVCTEQFTIFARWNNEFIAEKKLVIESSFTIRVFLKDLEIEMTELVDITSMDDVSSLLEKVENYSINLRC